MSNTDPGLMGETRSASPTLEIPRETTLQRRKRLGVCILCGEDRRGSPVQTCPTCTEKESLRRAGRKEQIRISTAARIAARTSAGLCIRCGVVPATEGRLCSGCYQREREQHAVRDKARATEYEAQGRCVKCGKATCNSGTKMCPACLVKARDRSERFRREHGNVTYRTRRQNGLCVTCGATCDTGAVRCQSCLEKSREDQRARSAQNRARWAAEGLCTQCGRDRQGEARLCPSCLLTTREAGRRFRRRLNAAKDAASICRYCSQPRWGISSMCQHHHILSSVRDYTADATVREALVEHLADQYALQEGRCAYTGEKLEPGKTAHIEHIFPKSKYPELAAEPTNLVWVSEVANTAKMDRDPHDPALDTFMLPAVLARIRDLASKVRRPQ